MELDGRFLDWRSQVAERHEIIREHHTREVKDVPPEIIARLEALEQFAATAADTINRLNADILACREEMAAVTVRLNALISDPKSHGLSPMAHYHDVAGRHVA